MFQFRQLMTYFLNPSHPNDEFPVGLYDVIRPTVQDVLAGSLHRQIIVVVEKACYLPAYLLVCNRKVQHIRYSSAFSISSAAAWLILPRRTLRVSLAMIS